MHCWAHASVYPALSAVQSPAPGQPVRMCLWEPKPCAVGVGDGGKKPRRSCVSFGVRRECRDLEETRPEPVLVLLTQLWLPHPSLQDWQEAMDLTQPEQVKEVRAGLGLGGPPWEFPSLLRKGDGFWRSFQDLVLRKTVGILQRECHRTPGTSGTLSTDLLQQQYSCLMAGTHS